MHLHHQILGLHGHPVLAEQLHDHDLDLHQRQLLADAAPGARTEGQPAEGFGRLQLVILAQPAIRQELGGLREVLGVVVVAQGAGHQDGAFGNFEVAEHVVLGCLA